MRREDLAVHVRREAVFEESFRELHRRSAEEWKNRFYIVFEGKDLSQRKNWPRLRISSIFSKYVGVRARAEEVLIQELCFSWLLFLCTDTWSARF